MRKSRRMKLRSAQVSPMNKQSNISLCGDDCSLCPRFLAKTKEELIAVAELWQRVG